MSFLLCCWKQPKTKPEINIKAKAKSWRPNVSKRPKSATVPNRNSQGQTPAKRPNLTCLALCKAKWQLCHTAHHISCLQMKPKLAMLWWRCKCESHTRCLWKQLFTSLFWSVASSASQNPSKYLSSLILSTSSSFSACAKRVFYNKKKH